MESIQNSRSLKIEIGKVALEADLWIPEMVTGLVIFSHGSGSSRLSKRNRFVASILHKEKLATLLFDLLTEEEDQVYEARFNIDLLTQRLIEVTRQMEMNPMTSHLPKGLFGASTGAASALMAAAELGNEIKAVVSRGGRVDMAMERLEKISAPTLFIVGEEDDVVVQLNEKAFKRLECTKKMEIIPGATHLFEEPGTLEEVARLTAQWFKKYLY